MTTRKNGLLVAADDLHVGKHYAVHGLKHAPDEPVSVAGHAFKVLAINLPFVVAKIVSDASHPPVTFDIRYLNFMPVTPEYVEAQASPHVPDAN
jgi:hypothetical protein